MGSQARLATLVGVAILVALGTVAPFAQGEEKGAKTNTPDAVYDTSEPHLPPRKLSGSTPVHEELHPHHSE